MVHADSTFTISVPIDFIADKLDSAPLSFANRARGDWHAEVVLILYYGSRWGGCRRVYGRVLRLCLRLEATPYRERLFAVTITRRSDIRVGRRSGSRGCAWLFRRSNGMAICFRASLLTTNVKWIGLDRRVAREIEPVCS